MKASEVNYLKFLEGTKQFVVPIYQRTYSWIKNKVKFYGNQKK